MWDTWAPYFWRQLGIGEWGGAERRGGENEREDEDEEQESEGSSRSSVRLSQDS